ncbi:LLM class flavin-dependent oxidoreductase [Spirillospora sp. CA-108201]
MTLTLHWFLPTYGDSRFIVGGGRGQLAGAAAGGRRASVGYPSSIVRAAEEFGFAGALTPTGTWCEDAWLTTVMPARESERLAFLVAFRPGLISPTPAARTAATFSAHAPGRLLLNVVTGGEDHDQRAYGDHLAEDERHARCDEFLSVVRRLWAGETVTHRGAHLDIDAARLPAPPDPVPPLYFGGSFTAAGPVAAERADATAEEAWRQAGRLVDALGEETVAAAQSALARSASTGQRRMRDLHERSRDGTWRDPRALEVAPNLWAGVGLVRGGAATALVGSHAEAADRIAESAGIGIDEFVLSGYPHLEELYWFGEGVLPHFDRHGLFHFAGGTGIGHNAFLPKGTAQ